MRAAEGASHESRVFYILSQAVMVMLTVLAVMCWCEASSAAPPDLTW